MSRLGADSTTTVVTMVSAGLEVTALHVNHGIRPDSDIEAARAETIALELGVRFASIEVQLADGPNLTVEVDQVVDAAGELDDVAAACLVQGA